MPSSLNSATLDFIRTNALADVRRIALRRPPEGVDLCAALVQIEGRQLAARKLPVWAQTEGILFPPRLSLEQCSGEAAAAYKRRVAGQLTGPKQLFVDLTGGLGADFAAIAPLFSRALYAELQPHLCELARHNLPLLGLPDAEVRCTSAERLLAEARPLLSAARPVVFLDPARRDAAGRKVALIEDCTPDVCSMQGELRSLASHVLVKLSPMLDLTAALHSLHPVEAAHVVSVGGECKELLLVMPGTPPVGCAPLPAVAVDDIPVCCVDLPASSGADGAGQPAAEPFVFTRAAEAAAPLLLAGQLGHYLYEPGAALMKAGAFKLLCQRFDVRKLAPSTHLYTSRQPVAGFPGRCWRILGHSTFAKSALRSFLADVPAAGLTTRGFPLSTHNLRRQLRLPEGGAAHLVATTLADGTRLLVKVERLDPS